MQVIITDGTLSANLTDTTSFQLSKSWSPNTAERVGSVYADVEEKLSVNIRGSFEEDIHAGARLLLQLQDSVYAWQELKTNPVHLVCSIDIGYASELRSLITDMKVKFPQSMLQGNLLKGVIGVEIELTRKGLFVGEEVVQYATASGVSGTVQTFNLSSTTTNSPTSLMISGLRMVNAVNSTFPGALPQGYLIANGRKDITQPSIVVIPASGITELNGVSGGTDRRIVDTDHYPIGNVIQYDDNAFNDTFRFTLLAGSTAFNQYNKIAVFMTGYVTNQTGILSELLTYPGFVSSARTYKSEPVFIPQSPAAPAPVTYSGQVLYLGTITKYAQDSLTSILFQFTFLSGATSVGSIVMDRFYLVGLSDETIILETQQELESLGSGTLAHVAGHFTPGYINGVPRGFAANTLTIPEFTTSKTPWRYRGNIESGTKSTVVDMVFLATNLGAYHYVSDVSGTTGRVPIKLGIARRYATPVVGM